MARRRFPTTVNVLIFTLLALAWLARDGLAEIFSTFIYLQTRGFILPGSGMFVPGVTDLAPPGDGASVLNWFAFAMHLAAARLVDALTPLPALWSRGHRLYYAAYVSVAYVLAAFGLIKAVRGRDVSFLICFWIFIAGALLQVFVAVDPSMRYGYTPQVFLFFCATMGWPAFVAAATGNARYPAPSSAKA